MNNQAHKSFIRLQLWSNSRLIIAKSFISDTIRIYNMERDIDVYRKRPKLRYISLFLFADSVSLFSLSRIPALYEIKRVATGVNYIFYTCVGSLRFVWSMRNIECTHVRHESEVLTNKSEMVGSVTRFDVVRYALRYKIIFMTSMYDTSPSTARAPRDESLSFMICHKNAWREYRRVKKKLNK